ncbi:MAG: hypothetical protein H6838_00005, partial [Planctomycetes bacterium]|nr:hypothetical protein [Planctomycetota bacterium]
MNPMSLTSSSPKGLDPDGGVEALRRVLHGRRRLLVLTHKNPDPDSLGGAMGLQEFAK